MADPYFLGVTGGIGSGKTQVCRILESLGAEIFYADDEAKKLMTESLELRRDIQQEFGDQAYTSEGELNRFYLAQRVFGFPDRLEVLNNLVHPRVADLFEQRKGEAREKQIPLYVKEAALMKKEDKPGIVDGILVVSAEDNVRISRLVEQGLWTESQIRERMEHQLSPQEFLNLGDYVIENNGTHEELEEKTKELWESIAKVHHAGG